MFHDDQKSTLTKVMNRLLQAPHNAQLVKAAEKGNIDVVRSLLEHGASADATASGSSALIWAIWYDHTDVARILIDADASLNDKFGGDGNTPLQWAIIKNNPDVVRMMIAKGADLNVQDSTGGYTALHWAVIHENKDIVRLLIDAGADLNIKNKYDETPLEEACAKTAKPTAAVLELKQIFGVPTTPSDEAKEIVKILKAAAKKSAQPKTSPKGSSV